MKETEMISSGDLVSHEIYDCGFGPRLHLRAQNKQRGGIHMKGMLELHVKRNK